MEWETTWMLKTLSSTFQNIDNNQCKCVWNVENITVEEENVCTNPGLNDTRASHKH